MAQGVDVSHESQVISSLRDRLTQAYRGRRSQDEVATAVGQALGEFDQAPIRDFVPLLVERLARDRLGRT